MKRKLTILATVMMVLVLAAPAWATTIDFATVASGYADGSQGLALNYGGMVITSKTQLIQSQVVLDPLPPLSQGIDANVYWGILGNLGVTGQSYTGLGVQRIAQSGTTGRPIDANEALVFTFNTPVLLQSINFTLEGLVNSSGTNDVFALRVSTLLQGHGGVNSAFNNTGVDLITSAIQTFSLDGAAFWPGSAFSSTEVDVIAIQSVSGAFGVKDLTFTPVPEPVTMLLFGFGLVGLAGLRRFKK